MSIRQQLLATTLLVCGSIAPGRAAQAQNAGCNDPNTQTAPLSADGIAHGALHWNVDGQGKLAGQGDALFHGQKARVIVHGAINSGNARIDSVIISAPNGVVSYVIDHTKEGYTIGQHATDLQYFKRPGISHELFTLTIAIRNSAQQAVNAACAPQGQNPPSPPADGSSPETAQNFRPIPAPDKMAVGVPFTGPGVPPRSSIAMIRALDGMPDLAQVRFGNGATFLIDPSATPTSPMQATVVDFVAAHERSNRPPAPAVIYGFPNVKNLAGKPDEKYIRVQIPNAPIQVEINTSSGHYDSRYPERGQPGITVHGIVPGIVVILQPGKKGMWRGGIDTSSGHAMMWAEDKKITYAMDGSFIARGNELPADPVIQAGVSYAAFALNMAKAANKGFGMPGDEHLVELANDLASGKAPSPPRGKAHAVSLWDNHPK